MGTYNPKLPTKASGTDKNIAFFVSRNREPTGADYRQPETGTLYSVGTVWQVAKNPTTGLEGDLWMLSKIVANVAYWISLSAGGAGTIDTILGDVGSISNPTVTIYADQANLGSGATVLFTNVGTVSTMSVTDSRHNTNIGKASGQLTQTGHYNTSLGEKTLETLGTGESNTCIGYSAGNLISSQGYNVAVGANSLLFCDESFNTAIGASALGTGTSMNNCIAIGESAGVSYLTNESFNICLGNQGVAAESNVLRLGTLFNAGVGQSTAYIAGVIGNTVANTELVTIDSVTGQLGVSAVPAANPLLQITVNNAVFPGTNPVVPSAGNINFTSSQVTNAGYGNVIDVQSLAANSVDFTIQQAGSAAAANINKNGVSHYNSAQFSVDPLNGFVSLVGAATGAIETLSDDVGAKAVPDGTGDIQLVGHVFQADGSTKNHTTVKGTNLININPMSNSVWIVDAKGFNGTHTTIQSAITAASAGDNIFVMGPYTYTENLSITKNITITTAGFAGRGGSQGANLTGKITPSAGVSFFLSGFQLTTNSDYILNTSTVGVAAFFQDCYFNMVNSNAILCNDSTTNIYIQDCFGTFTSTYTIGTITSGLLWIFRSRFQDGSSAAATTTASSAIILVDSNFVCPFSTSSTGTIQITNCTFGTILTPYANTTWLTTAGSSGSFVFHSRLYSGSASAISVGTGTSVTACNNVINSSNTNVFTGAGTINTKNNACTGSSSGNNVSTINTLTSI